MSKHWLVVVTCLVAAATAARSSAFAQTRNKSAHPIEITLVAITPTISPGGKVQIRATVKNLSAADFTLQHTYIPPELDASFAWEVQSPDGQEVRAEQLPRPKTLEFASHPLRPQESYAETITPYGYSLSKPGRYRVRVWRFLPKESGGGKVYSSWVIITVQQKP